MTEHPEMHDVDNMQREMLLPATDRLKAMLTERDLLAPMKPQHMDIVKALHDAVRPPIGPCHTDFGLDLANWPDEAVLVQRAGPAEAIDQMRDDPVAFASAMLGADLTTWQSEALRRLADKMSDPPSVSAPSPRQIIQGAWRRLSVSEHWACFSEWMTAMEFKEVAHQVAELRPPPAHADKQLHWVSQDLRRDIGGTCINTVVRWDGYHWWWTASVAGVAPEEAYSLSWRYLGPAEWHPPLYKERAQAAYIAKLEAHNKQMLQQIVQLSVMIHDGQKTPPYLPIAAATPPDAGPKADYHGPRDTSDPAYPAHKAVHDVAEHLLSGRVTNPQARRTLRDALDHADKPQTGPLPDGSHRNPNDKAFGGSRMQVGLVTERGT
jgi:hypothetical protein